MAELQNAMPPGWDCQLDRKSGRYYFVNHYTKTTTWDDPRLKPRHYPSGIHPSMTTESIPMQHGSPEFRRNYVYPSQNTPIPAFQIPAHCSPKTVPLQDLGHVSRNSPRSARVQDSSLSTTATNTEEAVAKISAMFPTVSDTHIRLLLKKYMKSIFPKADETMILDILSSNDNNIQKASDVLKEMGFEKRDSAKLSRHQQKPKPEPSKPKQEPAREAPATLKIKTLDDKRMIKAELQEKYKDIPEQVITIALESVEFDKERANHILHLMVQEENDKQTVIQPREDPDEITEVESISQAVTVVPLSQSRQSLKSILKTEKSDYSLKDTSSFSRVIEEPSDAMDAVGYRSQNLTNTHGADRSLVKGANQELLLEDYIKWQGPQPNLHKGPQEGLAKGSDPVLLSVHNYQPCGPNPELRKGPKLGRAKGSILSQLKDAVVGESRDCFKY
ncbi:hypothetical protein ILUMI_06940 [Ignelater luminosus]|uniref:BAG family molecular chaperone regulator 3 n=1 Tax=Ignelater luminosus TaxID=2038154 RepID=A0A8K0GIJ2_IGNLU|nr:hypothetical protein ILUMI_06940 [Ignelater luminosus]